MKIKSLITTLFLLLAMTCNVMAGELTSPKNCEVQEAAEPFTIVITENRVIGRDEPEGNDTGVRFYKGQTLTCYGLDRGWYKVQYGNRLLWVSSQYAKPVGPINYNSSYVVITGNRVIGRAAPGGISVRFYKGQKLPYLGQSGSWYKVRYNGRILWVSSKYSYVQ